MAGFFFIPPPILRLAQGIASCFDDKPQLHNLSRTQFLFELDVLRAAIHHPLRTYHQHASSVVLLPLLCVVSKQVGECANVPHGHTPRMKLLHLLVQQAIANASTLARPVPLLVPCTCVMQRTHYTAPLFGFLANRSRSIVAMTHARRAPPESLARMHVIAPYHTPPPLVAASVSRGRRLCEPHDDQGEKSGLLASFAGSPETTRQPVTCVRHHIFALARQAPGRIAAVASVRLGTSACAAAGSCVDGKSLCRSNVCPQVRMAPSLTQMPLVSLSRVPLDAQV